MKRIMGAIVILMGVMTYSYGAFEDVGLTARGRALGNAIFADFDGINSMNYNPANLAQLRSVQTYLSWDTPYTGLNDSSSINSFNASLAIPFWNAFTIGPDYIFTKRAAFAFSFHRMGVGATDLDGTETEFYHEGVYSFYYAKDLNDVISKGAKISAGLKFSVYDIGVGNTVDVQNNPDITKQGNISIGLDLGLTYDFSDTIHIGLSYLNLVAPNISILEGGKDTLPSELHFGVNWDIGDVLWVLKKSKLGFGLVSYGRDATDNRQAEMSWNLGYEFHQLTAGEMFKDSPYKGEILAIRLGASYLADKKGDVLNLYILQMQGTYNVTAGIGFTYAFGNQHQLTLDYTIEYAINMNTLQHVVALSYNLLLPASSFIYREEALKLKQVEDMIKNNPGMKAEYLNNGMFLTNSVVIVYQAGMTNEFMRKNGFILTNSAVMGNGFALTNVGIVSGGIAKFNNEVVQDATIVTNGYVLTGGYVIRNGVVLTNGSPVESQVLMTNGVKMPVKKKRTQTATK